MPKNVCFELIFIKNYVKVGYKVSKEVYIMQDRDFEWFLENYDDLFNIYGTSFLAIKNETVLGAYKSFREALDTTLLTEEIGTFIIQECDGTERAYTTQITSINLKQPVYSG